MSSVDVRFLTSDDMLVDVVSELWDAFEDEDEEERGRKGGGGKLRGAKRLYEFSSKTQIIVPAKRSLLP